MRNQNRPRIGITMRIELETERFYLARYYSEAVEGAGGTPVHIPLIPRADFIQHAVEGLDGILLPGVTLTSTRYAMDVSHTPKSAASIRSRTKPICSCWQKLKR